MSNPSFNRLLLNPDMVNVASNTNNIIPMNGPVGMGNSNLLGTMMGNNVLGSNIIGNPSASPSPQIAQNIQLGQMGMPMQMTSNAINDFSSKSMEQKMSTGSMPPPTPPTISSTPNTPNIKQEAEAMDIQDFKRSGDLQNMQGQQILNPQGASMGIPAHFRYSFPLV